MENFHHLAIGLPAKLGKFFRSPRISINARSGRNSQLSAMLGDGCIRAAKTDGDRLVSGRAEQSVLGRGPYSGL
jgi:hypothetical protein